MVCERKAVNVQTSNGTQLKHLWPNIVIVWYFLFFWIPHHASDIKACVRSPGMPTTGACQVMTSPFTGNLTPGFRSPMLHNVAFLSTMLHFDPDKRSGIQPFGAWFCLSWNVLKSHAKCFAFFFTMMNLCNMVWHLDLAATKQDGSSERSPCFGNCLDKDQITAPSALSADCWGV